MKAKAFAPATVANVAVGFDVLGFALKSLGETATVERISNSRQVSIDPVKNYPTLSTDPQKNTATAGLVQLMRDKKLNHGFHVSLSKTIPVGSGLGGSSTSAVAAIVAANALLKKPLSPDELLHYALIGEEVASGSQHGDNVAPCLLGGLVYVTGPNRKDENWCTTRIKTPGSLHAVVLLPDIRINTKDSRSSLKSVVEMKAMIQQTANLTGVIVGCMQGNFELIRRSMYDEVIEVQRAAQIPHFFEFQALAFKANALGCSISGSGPAIFAWTESAGDAEQIRKTWINAARKFNTSTIGAWTSPISRRGAYVIKVTR